MAPPAAALFAASGPTIPSSCPVPNFSGVLDHLLASLYPIIAATVDPSAGKIPIKVPSPEDLKINPFNFFNCCKLGSFKDFAVITLTASLSVDDCVNSSDIANNPIKTGTK